MQLHCPAAKQSIRHSWNPVLMPKKVDFILFSYKPNVIFLSIICFVNTRFTNRRYILSLDQRGHKLRPDCVFASLLFRAHFNANKYAQGSPSKINPFSIRRSRVTRHCARTEALILVVRDFIGPPINSSKTSSPFHMSVISWNFSQIMLFFRVASFSNFAGSSLRSVTFPFLRHAGGVFGLQHASSDVCIFGTLQQVRHQLPIRPLACRTTRLRWSSPARWYVLPYSRVVIPYRGTKPLAVVFDRRRWSAILTL